MNDLDRHSRAVFNEQFCKIGLILQLNVREDKLYIIPDADLDLEGFEREGGGRGVETYVYIHEQKRKYYT